MSKRTQKRHAWPEGHWDWPIKVTHKHGVRSGQMIWVGGQVDLTSDGEVRNAGDLMMVSVLLRLKASGMLDEYPNLSAYVARGEARPAYKRAFDAQLAVNKPPAG